jgi:hypothetical protein
MPLDDTVIETAHDLITQRKAAIAALKIWSVADLLGDEYSDELRYYYPDIQLPTYPSGTNIMVQLKLPVTRKVLPGGKVVYISDESQTTEQFRTQTALVRAVGNVAYCNRATLKLWPEGKWCRPGMFIRTPLYGGDRLAVRIKDGHPWRQPSDVVHIATFKDLDCLSLVIGDPLTIVAG